MTFAGWSLKRWAVLGLMLLAVALGFLRGPRLLPCPEGTGSAPCRRCDGRGRITAAEHLAPTRHAPCVFDPLGNLRECRRLLDHFQASGVHSVQFRTPDDLVSSADLSQILIVLLVFGVWLVDPLLFPVQPAPTDRPEAALHRAQRIAWIRIRHRLRLGAALALHGVLLAYLMSASEGLR
jgi:hypothetical protein